MRTQSPRVIIIGGGIGGLCLAQGLRQADIEVAVYERDRDPNDRLQGYRLHINPAGSRALHACLPPALWKQFVATAGEAGPFSFLDERLDSLVTVEEAVMYPATTNPSERHYAADRLTLRRILLANLDDTVQFNKEFERYERTADERVTAWFADGTSATGDLLVGADGAGSRVRRQYLPQTKRAETGALAVGFKLALTAANRSWLPPSLTAGMAMIFAPAPYFLFTAVFSQERELIESGSGELLAAKSYAEDGEGDRGYLLCAFVGRREAFPPGVETLDIEACRQVVIAMIARWHPTLRRIIADADSESILLVPLAASTSPAPWTTTNITLLGDAIHSMPPTGGLGGNTALRDAHLLCRSVIDVARGEITLTAAIGVYEAEMRDYGFAAVDGTLQTMQQGLMSNRLSVSGTRMWFRVCQAVSPLRRATFGQTWSKFSRPRSWESGARVAPRE